MDLSMDLKIGDFLLMYVEPDGDFAKDYCKSAGFSVGRIYEFIKVNRYDGITPSSLILGGDVERDFSVDFIYSHFKKSYRMENFNNLIK